MTQFAAILRQMWHTLPRAVMVFLAGWGLGHFWWLAAALLVLIAFRPEAQRRFGEQPGYVYLLSRLPGWRPLGFWRLLVICPAYVTVAGLACSLVLAHLTHFGDTIYYNTAGGFVVGLLGCLVIYLSMIDHRAVDAVVNITHRRARSAGSPALTRTPMGKRSALLSIRRGSKPPWSEDRIVANLTWGWEVSFWIASPPLIILSLAYCGLLLGLVAALLTFIPRCRAWLAAQPGYKRRLRWYFGFDTAHPLGLAAACLMYAAVPSAGFWYLVATQRPVLGGMWSVPAALVAAVLGWPLCYGLYLRGWPVPLPSLGFLRRLTPHHLRWHRAILDARRLVQEGQLYEARPLAHQAVEAARTSMGPRRTEHAASLVQQAQIEARLANPLDARRLYEQALDIYVEQRGAWDLKVGQVKLDLGHQCELLADYRAAEEFFFAALDVSSQGSRNALPLYAEALYRLGVYFLNIEDYEAAGDFLQEAIVSQNETVWFGQPSTLRTETALALAYARLPANGGSVERAYAFLSRAVQAGKRRMSTSPELAEAILGLASLTAKRGEYAEAIILAQRAMDLLTSIASDMRQIGMAAHLLADLHLIQGDRTTAERLYRQALASAEEAFGHDHPEVAVLLNKMAVLKIREGYPGEGLALIESALATENRMLDQMATLVSEGQYLAYAATHARCMATYLALVRQWFPSSTELVGDALDLVLGRKGSSLQLRAAQRQAIRAGRLSELTEMLQQLRTLKLQLAQKRLEGPGTEGIHTHRRILSEWQTKAARLEAELSQRIRSAPQLSAQHAGHRTAVAAAMPRGSALVEYLRIEDIDLAIGGIQAPCTAYRERYLAFVMTADDPAGAQLIDLGPAERINELADSYRYLITQPFVHDGNRDLQAASTERPKRLRDAGQATYEAIWEPITAALHNCKRVYVSADGDLCRLPFEVLPSRDGYLIDHYEISYLSAGRDLLDVSPRSEERSGPPVVMADPNFDLAYTRSQPGEPFTLLMRSDTSRKTGRFPRSFRALPETRSEGEHIAKLLAVKALLGEHALEAHLKSSRSPRLLHIATHGFFLPSRSLHTSDDADNLARATALVMRDEGRLSGLDDPFLRSGLALAGANTWLRGGALPPEAEDGILTAADAEALDLGETELVVLSACETGLGQIRDGEGVFGLRRAFVVAGAKTLVMSLWKVPDQQTRELMEDFYNRVLHGEPRARALHLAAGSVRRMHPEPFYWGAFICQGDPGPLPEGADRAQ